MDESTKRTEESTEKLNIKQSYAYLIFNLKNKKDVIEACNLYCEAFGAEKTSEQYLPGDWIGIDIQLFNLGIFIQSVSDAPRGFCCVHFKSEEDLKKAFNLLKEESMENVLHTDWHWTALSATITDKFGVSWLFCV